MNMKPLEMIKQFAKSGIVEMVVASAKGSRIVRSAALIAVAVAGLYAAAPTAQAPVANAAVAHSAASIYAPAAEPGDWISQLPTELRDFSQMDAAFESGIRAKSVRFLGEIFEEHDVEAIAHMRDTTAHEWGPRHYRAALLGMDNSAIGRLKAMTGEARVHAIEERIDAVAQIAQAAPKAPEQATSWMDRQAGKNTEAKSIKPF
jgi:hypothetical protein